MACIICARYYHPELKRFLNRAVLRREITDGQTFNRFAYVDGNPVQFIDPFGLMKGCERRRVLDNIAASKAAREASNFRSKGPGNLAEESWIRRILPNGNVVNDISGLPGAEGMTIQKRLKPQEMEFLTKEHSVEFAQVYHAGSGKNGGGGYYKLYSGTENSVNVPLGPDVRLISHTHPKGTSFASPQDMRLMKLLEKTGSKQRVPQMFLLVKV